MSKAKDDYYAAMRNYRVSKQLDEHNLFTTVYSADVTNYVTELEKEAEMFDEAIDLLKDIYCNYKCGKKIDDQIRPFFDRAKKLEGTK